MNLSPALKEFEYMLSKQSEWATQYVEQERDKRIIKNETIRLKKYYGNSTDYKKVYSQIGAHVYK